MGCKESLVLVLCKNTLKSRQVGDYIILFYSFLIHINIHKYYEIEVLLSSLRSKQKLLVEDLKKQTSYYLTKNLLDRYSGSSTPARRTSAPNHLQQQQHHHQNINASSSVPQASLNTTARHSGPFHHQPNHHLHHRQQQQQQMATAVNNTAVTRTFWDRLLDSIVGDESFGVNARQKYALICGKCHQHNGIVPAEEFI